ncbi:rsbT co-antagonist protein RsbR [Mesobacillus persicus]|uniref:RsbT co-antagonist protein RsbR n=1 Tax=Mesobacillus persicus TaxID=930146 RepID=A0A1H8FQM5_9BACI|nr:STAS domain-containing protein [Mesobacillus persicus]SEN33996.1 rsbT co-antagonist protein RsbR [Mesobacillus persicus]
MQKNKELYHFLLQRVTKLTEEWYEGLDKSDPTGIYSSLDPEVIKNMKQQNIKFHEHFIEIFNMDEKSFTVQFDPWIHEIASDQQHLKTPLQFVIREFMRTRSQYLESIQEFAEKYPKHIVPGQVEEWNLKIVTLFDTVILKFTEETYKYSNYQLQAQQEMINELSSPVISLTKGTALLPLVGDIDTTRAKMIIDNALNQCATRGVKHLCIDLSGVIMIDTMVAQQLFQLINALKLIGVKATLSGIRPEIATTAVKLGLSFDDVEVRSTLAQALSPKLSMI